MALLARCNEWERELEVAPIISWRIVANDESNHFQERDSQRRRESVLESSVSFPAKLRTIFSRLSLIPSIDMIRETVSKSILAESILNFTHLWYRVVGAKCRGDKSRFTNERSFLAAKHDRTKISDPHSRYITTESVA